MAEPLVPDQTASSGRGAGLVAKARAHKMAATIIAVAGFRGLGGIFGQWAVDRIGDLIKGDQPPAGFEELHRAWQTTAKLDERLLDGGGEATRNLEQGTEHTIRGDTSRELEEPIRQLQAVKRQATGLAGRVRATAPTFLVRALTC